MWELEGCFRVLEPNNINISIKKNWRLIVLGMEIIFWFLFCSEDDTFRNITPFFFFFHWHYSPLWALACRTMSFHFFLSATNSLHLLTHSTWRSLSTSSFHLFLGLPLLLVPSSSYVKIFLAILSSYILSRWLNLLILCPHYPFEDASWPLLFKI